MGDASPEPSVCCSSSAAAVAQCTCSCLVPPPSLRRAACYAFLLIHPVLVATAEAPSASSSAAGGFASRILAYYSSCWLPRCAYVLVLASLPAVSGLLQLLFGFAEQRFPSGSPADEDEPLEGVQDLRNAPAQYGLQHTALNLRVDGYWLNMGYWKNATSFADACSALTKKVAEAAQLRVGDKVLDVGYGCGDQDIYIYNQYKTEEIVGLTSEPVQAQLARRRVRELGLQNRIRLYLGDAAHLSDFVAKTGLFSEQYLFDRVLAIDCAYHFRTREKFFCEAFRRLRPNGWLALTDILPSPGVEPSSNSITRAVCALAGIPPENLTTSPAEYRQKLEAIGYEDIQMEFIEDDVFPGLAQYIDAQTARLGSVISPATRVRLALVGWFLRRLQASGGWHFVVVAARKPYERL